MKRLGQVAAAVALSLAASIGLSGCPALLIPGLAVEGIYEGYKYHKSGSESSQPAPSQDSSNGSQQKKKVKTKHKPSRKRHHS